MEGRGGEGRGGEENGGKVRKEEERQMGGKRRPGGGENKEYMYTRMYENTKPSHKLDITHVHVLDSAGCHSYM